MSGRGSFGYGGKRRRVQQHRLTSFFASGSGGKGDNRTTDRADSNGRMVGRKNPDEAQAHLSSSPSASRFGECPICMGSFPIHLLEVHAEGCDGTTDYVEATGNSESKSSDVRCVSSWAEPRRSDSSRNSPQGTIVQGSSLGYDRGAIADGGNSKESIGEMGEKGRVTPDVSETLTKTVARLESQHCNLNWWKKPVSNKPQHRDLDDDDGDGGVGVEKKRRYISPTSEPISGLFLFENFVTEAEECLILREIDDPSLGPRWAKTTFNGPKFGKRWGVHCNLRERKVTAADHPLPNFVRDVLLPRLGNVRTMAGCVPNEANAIDYRRGMGHYLSSHVDDRQLSKEPIANVSLVGDCFMTFKPDKKMRGGANVNGGAKKVLLARRSVMVMTGKARYNFSHGIENRDLLSDRRVSVTMRESTITGND